MGKTASDCLALQIFLTPRYLAIAMEFVAGNEFLMSLTM